MTSHSLLFLFPHKLFCFKDLSWTSAASVSHVTHLIQILSLMELDLSPLFLKLWVYQIYNNNTWYYEKTNTKTTWVCFSFQLSKWSDLKPRNLAYIFFDPSVIFDILGHLFFFLEIIDSYFWNNSHKLFWISNYTIKSLGEESHHRNPIFFTYIYWELTMSQAFFYMFSLYQWTKKKSEFVEILFLQGQTHNI